MSLFTIADPPWVESAYLHLYCRRKALEIRACIACFALQRDLCFSFFEFHKILNGIGDRTCFMRGTIKAGVILLTSFFIAQTRGGNFAWTINSNLHEMNIADREETSMARDEREADQDASVIGNGNHFKADE